MKIVVITDEALKKELLAQDIAAVAEIEWLDALPQRCNADCYIDLLFYPATERVAALQQLQPALIIVNSVITSSKDLPVNFVRINGWPTFLKRNITEASCSNNSLKEKAEEALVAFNKKIEWAADIPGFITARVIGMIINEAYFTLDEKVSTKDEIDTAMKLGTNYPYGPFEWAQLTGLKNVYDLLHRLAETNSRYTPSALLQKEALSL